MSTENSQRHWHPGLSSSPRNTGRKLFPTAGPLKNAVKGLGKGLTAVNVSDNSHAVGLSSIAASVAVLKSGAEPGLSMVTRDRNRIAIQSDLLGPRVWGLETSSAFPGTIRRSPPLRDPPMFTI